MKDEATGGCINAHGEAGARQLHYGGAAQGLQQVLGRGVEACQHAGAMC